MSSQTPQVSVLIPCRNGAKHIEHCLTNIYGFTPPPGGFEVVVIDGMSNDGTFDILSQLKNRFPDLIIINNPDKIVPRAMNLGIQYAKGEYIVSIDSRCIHSKSYLCDLIELRKAFCRG